MISTPNLTHLIQSFFRLHMISRRDVSTHTVHAYRDAIRLFLIFAASRAPCAVTELHADNLDRETLLAFLEDLETTRHNSPTTRNARLSAIHSFFRFVAVEEPALLDLCRRVLSVPYKKTPVPIVTCLDRDDVEHILAQIDCTKPAGRRDAALLHLLYNTGARAQEIVNIRPSAIRFDVPFQVRLLGKGRKERVCPLWPETISRIRTMRADHPGGIPEDAPLFLNAAGRPLTRFGLRHIVRSCVATAAKSRPTLTAQTISPHTFRHSTALHLIQSGVEINVVKNWLGHSSIETTHGYIEIDMKMKCAALDACGAPKTPSKARPWNKPDVLSWLESL